MNTLYSGGVIEVTYPWGDKALLFEQSRQQPCTTISRLRALDENSKGPYTLQQIAFQVAQEHPTAVFGITCGRDVQRYSEIEGGQIQMSDLKDIAAMCIIYEPEEEDTS